MQQRAPSIVSSHRAAAAARIAARTRRALRGFALLLALVGVGCATHGRAPADRPGQIPEAALPAVLAAVAHHYVRPVAAETLTCIERERRLDALDPYCAFLDAPSLQAFDAGTQGMFGGIGVVLDEAGGTCRIRGPMRGSPAEAAGIVAGDELLAVDGREVAGDLEATRSMLMGPAGSAVQLDLRRKGVRRSCTLTRAAIQFGTVRGSRRRPDGTWDYRLVDSDVAYLRISGFTASTVAECDAALAGIAAAGCPNLVLDLRDNVGGLAAAAIAIADRFLASGRIVAFHERGDHGEVTEVHDATPGAIELPIVVLTSGETISAGEILAAALQDNGRAVVAGARTFGKGTSQRVFRLAGGEGVKLTIATNERPAGAPIERRGPGGSPERGGVWPTPGLSVAATVEQWKEWSARLADLDLRAEIAGDDAAVVVDRDPLLVTAIAALPAVQQRAAGRRN